MSHNTHSTVGQRGVERQESRVQSKIPQFGLRSHAGPRLSALDPRLLRRGINLTEVLIAMGILTVGLLGVASLFPVASFYMQKGDIADRGSAVAQAAFNNALSSGMLDPQNWLMFEPSNTPAPNRRWTYSKLFAKGLADVLASQALEPNMLIRNRTINYWFGYAYVIDPLGTNSSPLDPSNAIDRRQVSVAQRLPIEATVDYASYSQWWPWNPNPISTSDQSPPRWPVIRVTLPQPPGTFSPWPMTAPIADRLFRSADDLSLELPAQSDKPSRQLMSQNDLNGDSRQDALARQSQGNYSWILTVVPPDTNARNALATNPSSFAYEVSVAVFYRRILDDAQDANRGERLTIAKVVSTGLNGGELLIEKRSNDSATEPFSALKVGQWVPVCGPSPTSTNANPRFIFRWYRILSIEKGTDVVSDPSTQRMVSLRGPQWPWQPAADLASSDLSNNLCLSIIPNVVAVHSKTIRLEGKSAWSAN